MALTGVVCSRQPDVPKRQVSAVSGANPSLAWGEQPDETTEFQCQVSKLCKQQLEHHAFVEQLLSKHFERIESSLRCAGFQKIPAEEEIEQAASIANPQRKPSTIDASDVPQRKSPLDDKKQIAFIASEVPPSLLVSSVDGVVPGPEMSPPPLVSEPDEACRKPGAEISAPSLVSEPDEAFATACHNEQTGRVNNAASHDSKEDSAADEDSYDGSKQGDVDLEPLRQMEGELRRLGPSLTSSKKKCWLQRTCHAIMHNKVCEISVTAMICLSSLSAGIQSDWRIQHLDDELPLAFRIIDLCFTAVFSTELIMRSIDEGWRFLSIYNKAIGWNLFDSVVVLAALLDELSSVLPNVKALRTLRVLRLARILRVLRVMRFFRDLRNMIAGIIGSLQSLVWCLLLLFMMMFMYSLLLLQLLGDGGLLGNEKDEQRRLEAVKHFGSLMRCMYTLCLSITGGVEWGDQGGLLLELSPLLGCVHILFMCFCILCVLNIVTSVFVEKAGAFTKADIDSLLMEDVSNREKFLSDMREIFSKKRRNSQMSGDDDDLPELLELDEQQFVSYIEDKRVQAYFKKIGLHVEKENAQALFKMIDLDESGTVGLEEFVDGCSQFVGNARQLDIARLRHDNRLIMQHIAKLSILLVDVDQPKKARLFADDNDVMPKRTAQPNRRQTLVHRPSPGSKRISDDSVDVPKPSSEHKAGAEQVPKLSNRKSAQISPAEPD